MRFIILKNVHLCKNFLRLNRLFRIISFLAIVTTVIFLSRCANPVTPSGGPKDTTPPQFIKSEPPQLTTYFHSKSVRIYFDEYVELKDVQKNLIISPPVKTEPELKIKGKSVVITFDEDFLSNTTYNIYFGDAIVDVNEGNPVSNFQYVFSTGAVIDSMTLSGYVYDAFTLKPVESANVMLYYDMYDTIPFDSAPFYVRPYYMTRTDKQGNFVLNNIRDLDYKIFALKDENSSMTYDQPSEQIAFLDTLIRPYYIPPEKLPDTVLRDTTMTDTVQSHTVLDEDTVHFVTTIEKDTVVKEIVQKDTTAKVVELFPHFDLAVFTQVDSTQRFIKADLVKPGQVDFIFKRPVSELEINPLNFTLEKGWALKEFGATGDTVTYWLAGLPSDSLVAQVIADDVVLDTVEMALKKIAKTRKQKKEEKNRGEIKLTAKLNVKGGVVKLNKPVLLIFDYPVKEFDFSNVVLFGGEDSLNPEIVFIDSLKRKAEIDYEWKQSSQYSLIIPDSALIDIQGHTNDTLRFGLSTKANEDYGFMFVDVKVSEPGKDYLIQLIIDDKIIREDDISQDTELKYEYLDPGSYILKVIYDENKNGQWDAGNYIYGIQPEKVRFYNGELNVRANWDLKEEWDLE